VVRVVFANRLLTGILPYRSKMNPSFKRNFALFPVLDWILAITAHIPNKGEQKTRFFEKLEPLQDGDIQEILKQINRISRKKKYQRRGLQITAILPAPTARALRH